MKKKPILRWTVGNVKELGIEILRTSVYMIKKLYPQRFQLYVCHNNITADQLQALQGLGVHLYPQSHCPEVAYKPRDVAWKLYPPRLDIGTHEIFMDNDIVMHDRLEEIDLFLQSDRIFFMTEALLRLFGKYDKYILEGYKFNSGLFGIPPGFHFAEAMNAICKQDTERMWGNRYDEQGLVATIISNQNQFYVIPKKKISVCMGTYLPATHGVHFIGANAGDSRAWHDYLKKRTKC